MADLKCRDGSPSATSYQTAPSPSSDLTNSLDALRLGEIDTSADQDAPTTSPQFLQDSIDVARPPVADEAPVPQASASSSGQPNVQPSSSAPAPANPVDAPIIKAVVSPPPPSRRTCVLLQERCKGHVYARSTDIGTIVERPERIRAVKTGVAAAWARLEAQNIARGVAQPQSLAYPKPASAEDELEQLMSGLGIKDEKGKAKEVASGPFDILLSNSVMPVDAAALRFVHPLPNQPPDPLILPPNGALFDVTKPWPHQLVDLCRNAAQAIRTDPYSEIPSHLPQGDLYLSEGSEAAIFGSMGAVTEGVDRIVEGSRAEALGYDRAFVVVRPPGHHCCEKVPMGFCFVNNVAVAAAHAYLRHGIDRIVIFDIDLHHGNGTQEIVWRINEETHRAAMAAAAKTGSPRKGSPKKAAPVERELKIFYGSLHDVNSYPCEDGDPNMIQAASINLAGPHGQWISNVHLETCDRESGESAFHTDLYPKYRDGLLERAADFCRSTAVAGDAHMGDRTLVIVSAGFDASEHESAGMSRHSRNVPTSFFHRFMRDCCRFANDHASGKVLAVLEGGYSDRALASGALALTVGLVESPRRLEQTFVDTGSEGSWWSEPSLVKLEKACKSRRGKLVGPASTSVAPAASRASDEWLARAVEIMSLIEGTEASASPKTATPKEAAEPGQKMQLRERRPRGMDTTPQPSPVKIAGVSRAKAIPSTSSAAPVAAFNADRRQDDAPVAGRERAAQSVQVHPQGEQTGEEQKPIVEQERARVKFVWKAGGL